ncbi:MAG TPA: hypothetical protein VHA11_00500 [Bryobacteraceae bacterium]|nr:hypothetical protein [Bryobacteraceae bacterium]
MPAELRTTSPGTRWFVAAAIVCLTLLGFFRFPGHTFLQSDTQIYIPILERFWDSSVFGRELLALEPHVSFTIYDEMALLLRHATGMDFQSVLVAQQLIFRALGLLGIYLIASSLGLRARLALLVTAIFSLGATIGGPAVLTIEYEPVPRGFAIPLLLLAIGLVAHGRDLGAGIVCAAAFLYHPPTVLPFWIVYFLLTLWPAKPAIMGRRIMGLAPLLAAAALLLLLSRAQHGITEPQDFFGRISPQLEALQRMRAPYNWISQWPSVWPVQYLALWALSLGAFWRMRRSISQDLRFFLLGLPVIGILSMPFSYLLLERMKWMVVPQLQPARALLFVAVVATVLAASAAVRAASAGRWWEGALWLIPVFALPAHTRVLEIVLPDLADPLIRVRVVIVAALAVLTAFAAWAVARGRRWALAPWTAAIVLPFLLIPGWGRMRNYPPLETPELDQVASWARASTSKDAIFFFPDAGRGLAPGVFRARALRALYVDWKAGGQSNFLKGFAREWWTRWQATGAGRFTGVDPERYRALGIDYIVLSPAHRLPARAPDFANRGYVVYRLAPSAT